MVRKESIQKLGSIGILEVLRSFEEFFEVDVEWSVEKEKKGMNEHEREEEREGEEVSESKRSSNNRYSYSPQRLNNQHENRVYKGKHNNLYPLISCYTFHISHLVQ